jgi:quinol monooxygenase YgiN
LIIVTARLECHPGHEQELEAAARDAVAATRAEDGCLAYSFLRDLAGPASYVFVEEWADQDALRTHIGTDHLRAFRRAARDHIAGQQITVHTVTESQVR